MQRTSFTFFALLAFLCRVVMAHPVSPDGDPTDWDLPGWQMEPPLLTNVGHIGRAAPGIGQYAWTDEQADHRDDFGASLQDDILQARITGDSQNLYIMAQLGAIDTLTGNGAPQIQVAIDVDGAPTVGTLEFGSFADTSVHPEAAWEYLIITRFGSGSPSPFIYLPGFGGPTVDQGLAVASDQTDVIEISVPWAAIPGIGDSTIQQAPYRFSIALFRTDGVDSTWDIGGPFVSNALDVVSKIGPHTWHEVGDQVVDSFFDVWFDVDTGEPFPPLMINEFLANPAGVEPGEEFIEIVNAGPLSMDLHNVKLGDEETPGNVEGMKLLAGELESNRVFLVAGDADDFMLVNDTTPNMSFNINELGIPVADDYSNWATGFVLLGDTGDEILLLDSCDTVLDVITYGTSVWPGTLALTTLIEGASYERNSSLIDTNEMDVDFESRTGGGTPGRLGQRIDNIFEDGFERTNATNEK